MRSLLRPPNLIACAVQKTGQWDRLQGFIQDIHGGGEKNNICGAAPPRGSGVNTVMLPLRLLLGAKNGWKLATIGLLSIKKNVLQNSGGGGEEILVPPLYETLH